MIRITVEMVPGGNESRAHTIGTTIIHNVGGSHARGDYKVAVAHKDRQSCTREILTNPLRRGVVTAYPRLSYNVWRLVIRALVSAFPEERGTVQQAELEL